MANTFRASELYESINSERKASVTKEMQEQKIDEDSLDDIDIRVDPVTKNIDISSSKPIKRKHALFLAMRLGFPMLVGIGLVYRNQGEIPFNVTLNAQTMLVYATYSAGIAWNFYKGFFVGAVAHHFRPTFLVLLDSPPIKSQGAYGAQVGFQHAFGESERLYIDVRAEAFMLQLNNYEKDSGLFVNANMAVGVRF